jgi:hypothetical protein
MKNLTKAFNDLRRKGYFARQNFTCCQSCGWAEVPNEYENRAVFYHQQDQESMREGGDLYLAWAGNGQEIVKIFEKYGFLVDWNGDNRTRIKVCVGGTPATH